MKSAKLCKVRSLTNKQNKQRVAYFLLKGYFPQAPPKLLAKVPQADGHFFPPVIHPNVGLLMLNMTEPCRIGGCGSDSSASQHAACASSGWQPGDTRAFTDHKTAPRWRGPTDRTQQGTRTSCLPATSCSLQQERHCNQNWGILYTSSKGIVLDLYTAVLPLFLHFRHAVKAVSSQFSDLAERVPYLINLTDWWKTPSTIDPSI